jgi:hypothetical protein
MNGPRGLIATFVLGVAALAAALALCVAALLYAVDQKHAACERSVDAREDNRAMWIWAADTLTGGAEEFAIAMRIQLDERLPSTECIDNIPTPIKEETS